MWLIVWMCACVCMYVASIGGKGVLICMHCDVHVCVVNVMYAACVYEGNYVYPCVICACVYVCIMLHVCMCVCVSVCVTCNGFCLLCDYVPGVYGCTQVIKSVF